MNIHNQTPIPANSRRTFMLQAVTGCVAAGMTLQAKAQAMVLETDAQAAALGYKADALEYIAFADDGALAVRAYRIGCLRAGKFDRCAAARAGCGVAALLVRGHGLLCRCVARNGSIAEGPCPSQGWPAAEHHSGIASAIRPGYARRSHDSLDCANKNNYH